MNIASDDKIAAILPRYTDNGDGTVIIDAKGQEVFYPVGYKPIIRQLAGRHCKDICLLRDWAKVKVGRRLWLPLGFSWELVLTPIKVRDVRVKGDGTLGYVNLTHIKRVKEIENIASVELNNGMIIPVLWQLETLRHHLKDAILLHFNIVHVIDKTIWKRLYKNVEMLQLYKKSE
ncbi:hypothetical protein [Pectinatus frisingensis]|jgi:hypothetical protein|uniref:hypothetical protein n=1 Tax=Pectinatus frisingensis TaxID=865 RepID=UPI0018C5E0BC|nr:hypothetical protein [Pectinatus frisingensis]